MLTAVLVSEITSSVQSIIGLQLIFLLSKTLAQAVQLDVAHL